MKTYSAIVLKAQKEQSVMRRHPWIFSGAIQKKDSSLQEGDVVNVFSSIGNFLAVGHYQIGSIAVRLLSFEQEAIDASFWEKRVRSAVEFRKNLQLLGNEQNNVFRLIHGEGDQLPGLIVDYYAGCAVMQAHSVGMFLAQAEIIAAMRKVMGDSLVSVFDKSEGTLPFKADIDPHNGYVWGEGSPAVVLENGLKFRVNWETGQKTGFFVDQRDNRFLVEKYSKNRRVLNMFGYTGGFSVYALRGGASHVDTVDVSEKAIKLTDENVEINFGNDAPHTSYAVDAFDYMKTMEQKYDLIILDPPAFAKHMNVLDKALQAYKRLNQRAIEKIEPGGILFTFSCSQVVSKLDFRKSVFAAAANAKRNVRIIHQLDQPSDHPVNIFHPESEYLKGLVLHIE